LEPFTTAQKYKAFYKMVGPPIFVLGAEVDGCCSTYMQTTLQSLSNQIGEAMKNNKTKDKE